MAAASKMAPTGRQEYFPFLKLPRELRDEIYDLTLSYGGIRHFIKARGDDFDDLFDKGTNLQDYFQTPEILLVSKQISDESLQRLRSKPLVITTPPHFCADEERPVLPKIITTRALLNIQHIQLALPDIKSLHDACSCDGADVATSARLWLYLLMELCRVLDASQSLACLRITCPSAEYKMMGSSLPKLLREIRKVFNGYEDNSQAMERVLRRAEELSNPDYRESEGEEDGKAEAVDNVDLK